MRIPVDRNSEEPIYQQVVQFLQQRIQSGALQSETRLPSSRSLSADLGVSRITVVNAYEELEAEGFVYSRPGSGTYVAPKSISLPEPQTVSASPGDWPLWQQELLSRTWLSARREMDDMIASVTHPAPISFIAGLVAEDVFPAEEFRKTMNLVLRREGHSAFDYGDRAGYTPLRTTVAHILTNQGIPASPDEVLITSGSQQAIALVSGLLLHSGDVVLVETPTYIGAIDLFRSMDVRILGIPVDSEGIVISELERALQSTRPRLIYTIPTFHNPTGVCMSGTRRRQLIELAVEFNIPILEDDCFGDLRYEGRALPALKALDPGGQVIYINTFSKMLMPGLRTGYLVASGPVYDRLLASKYTLDLATCNPIQRALEEFVSVGSYQAHLRRACRFYRGRRDAMIEALKRHMPDGVRWNTPQGGLCLWLQLPEVCSATALFSYAAEEGVIYAPGSVYFPGERVQPCLRLNFGIHAPDKILEGSRRLGIAINRYLSAIDNSRHQNNRKKEVAV